MSHQCSNLLIRPMDFRLQPAIEKWLDQKGYNGDTDMIAVAGACKDFVKDPENCMGTYLWSELDTSYRLHQIKK